MHKVNNQLYINKSNLRILGIGNPSDKQKIKDQFKELLGSRWRYYYNKYGTIENYQQAEMPNTINQSQETTESSINSQTILISVALLLIIFILILVLIIKKR